MATSETSEIILSGRRFTPAIIKRINQFVKADGDLTRTALAREVCQWLDWVDGSGRAQVSSCVVALGKLEQRGVIVLPSPKRRVSSKAKAKRPATRKKPRLPEAPVPPPSKIPKTVRGIHGLFVERIDFHQDENSRIWNWLITTQHPQGDKPIMGRQIRYLIGCEEGWLGAASFSASAWRLAARDEHIGWSEEAREDNLQKVVAMSRFLIRNEVRCENLASKTLALLVHEMAPDWQERYGERPLLLESFVDPRHFNGSCYRAANWIYVGQTKGRGRQDRDHECASGKKDIYLYALESGYKAKLCASPRAPLCGALEPLGFERQIEGENWAAPEFEDAELGDERLGMRAAKIAQGRFANPTEGILSLGVAEAKAAYRFFESKREEMTMPALLAGHIHCTVRRMASQKVVLCPQDTTRLNYDGLKKTAGLGSISGNQTGHQAQGLHLHSTFCTTAEGVPLGVLDAYCWARKDKDKKAKTPRGKNSKSSKGSKKLDGPAKPSEEPTDPTGQVRDNEGRRWLFSYQACDAAAQRLEEDTVVVNICDREGDIYELFHEATRPERRAHLLVRANHNRSLEKGRAKDQDQEPPLLWPHLRSQPVCGKIQVRVPGSENSPERIATVQVRHAKVKLRAPNKSLPNLRLWAVYALEKNPPKGCAPIEWMLLTTLEIDSAPSALEKLRWYCHRWKIEEWHKVLKSGCKIETKQLKDAEALKRAIAIDMVVAWRVLLLTKLSREQPDLPASVAFTPAEYQVLEFLGRRRQKKRQIPEPAKNQRS